jgi:predicted dehydrogenase
MVGYNFRFYPPLQLMKQALLEERIGRLLTIRAKVGLYLPDWREDQDYRRGASVWRDLGAGVVLELSHELDYVRRLVGEVKTVSVQSGMFCRLSVGQQ